MKPLPELRARLAGAEAKLFAAHTSVRLGDLALCNPLSVPLQSLKDARVLIRTTTQLDAALALVALDGVAARMVIAPPDLKPEHLQGVIARAQIDVVVGEEVSGVAHAALSAQLRPAGRVLAKRASEWVMFTSGTTGAPKMVAHSLAGLTGGIKPGDPSAVWGTFYDIRRFGGLQILLRALLGRTALVLSDADESAGDFLTRLGRHGVTHLTGTPSHWRRALMSPAIANIAPRYVRLSGEIADQAVLDSLKAQFPHAAIAHAYASTEAGLGFEVTDGREGFPAGLIGADGLVALKVVDGALHVRSPRAAACYVGSDDCLGEDGWVDTGDMVELRSVRGSESDQDQDDRYYFAGRRGGIINVGGLKIHPEEVEAVINRHPAVRLSRVSGRRSPITGALVVADIVLADAANDNLGLKDEILGWCRANLPAFKVPASLKIVDRLELTAGGKLQRVPMGNKPHA